MCGIAGLIHRGKSSNVGSELQGMLQALKHRGEDSTGYALYGDTDGKNFIMRFKVGENVGEGSSSIMEDVSVYDERKKNCRSIFSRIRCEGYKRGKNSTLFIKI
jgi:glutamate synthase domain-containing protein 1